MIFHLHQLSITFPRPVLLDMEHSLSKYAQLLMRRLPSLMFFFNLRVPCDSGPINLFSFHQINIRIIGNVAKQEVSSTILH